MAWRLQDPALGTPKDIANVLADQMVLLLDGFDELVDLDNYKAKRFLDAVGTAHDDKRIDQRILMTTRPNQYNKIVSQRCSGTAAVSHSVMVKPYPSDTIDTLLENRDPPLNELLAEVERCDSIRTLPQRPLWLSLAIELFTNQTHRHHSPN